MINSPDTQQKSVVPLSDVTKRAHGSLQWLLEKDEDKNTPVFQFNNLTVHICGADSFKQIAQDIQTAQSTIDIIAWGFDPAMELTRCKARPWGQRGDTYGDLLRDAALGLLSRNRTEDGWFHAAAITKLILKPKAAARRCSAAMLR